MQRHAYIPAAPSIQATDCPLKFPLEVASWRIVSVANGLSEPRLRCLQHRWFYVCSQEGNDLPKLGEELPFAPVASARLAAPSPRAPRRKMDRCHVRALGR